MIEATTPHDPDDALVSSWLLHLTAERKSPGTRRQYATALRQFRLWLATRGLDLLHVTRRDVVAYFAELEASGLEGATRRNRWVAMRSLYNWLVAEDEVAVNPTAQVTIPKANTKPVRVLDDEDLRRLFASLAAVPRVAAPNERFRARRDLAILRLMVATGLRLSEAVNLRVDDIDLTNRLVVVRRGKGGKARVTRMDPVTARAVDRYLRARARHHSASLANLWLGAKGPFGVEGVSDMVMTRCAEAGLGHVHPHMLRHTWAHRFLAHGGQEGDLARLGGWDSLEVMRRYGRSVAVERALDAYDSIDLMGGL